MTAVFQQYDAIYVVRREIFRLIARLKGDSENKDRKTLKIEGVIERLIDKKLIDLQAFNNI